MITDCKYCAEHLATTATHKIAKQIIKEFNKLHKKCKKEVK